MVGNQIIFISLLLWSSWIFIEGKICPGFCVPHDLCTVDGGKVLGLCVNRRVCCDVSHKLNRSTCGKIIDTTNLTNKNKPIEFVSPLYPGHSSGNLICQFELKLDKNTVGVRLEMDKFELQNNYSWQVDGEGLKVMRSQCDADMFFIKGFSDWMTNPICGYLNGFSFLIDIPSNEYAGRKLILLFIMSSKEFRWRIRLQQIGLLKLRKSEICLQTRLSQLAKDLPNFPLKIPLRRTKSTGQISIIEGKALPRWAWDVDIVTRALAHKISPCQKKRSSHNDSESYPYLRKLCSGTILDERHILTTASCFWKSMPHFLKDLAILTAGFCPVDSRTPGDHYYSLESVTLHFNYISSVIHNDVAILRTKKPIKFGEFVQPISIFGGNSRHLVFSPNKPQPMEENEKAVVLTPSNDSECSRNQALHIDLETQVLGQYIGSNKYKHLMTNWICFPGNLSQIYLSCPAELSLFQGASLVGVKESGEDVHLIGIFNHAMKIQHSWDQRPKSFVGNLLKGNETGNSLVYFTKIQFFEKFLLLALS